MHVLAIDDERLALENLIFSLKEALPGATIHSFITPESALEFTQNLYKESNQSLDFAFLDVVMSTMSGLEVAVSIKKLFPEVDTPTTLMMLTDYMPRATSLSL